MDDGVTFRADVFRHRRRTAVPRHPVHGPYAKGLPFQVGYQDRWEAMVSEHPEVTQGFSCRYQNWEVVGPGRGCRMATSAWAADYYRDWHRHGDILCSFIVI